MNQVNTNLPNSVNKERIASLDLIRGVAVLGILLMNIQSFSMIGQAYLNPMAYGDMTGVNRWVWIISHVLADQKFLSIFSMLFGASLFMIADKAEQRTGSSLKMHYKRNFWLLIFGLTHAVLFWYGDILAPYAFCSFFIYFFRKWPVKRLLVFGICVFSVSTIVHVIQGLGINDLPEQILDQMKMGWQPPERFVKYMVSGYQGDFSAQLEQRLRMVEIMYTSLFPNFYIWRISGLMLIGVALFKSGFLQGNLPISLYRKVLLAGLPIGLILVVSGLLFNFHHEWSIRYSMAFGGEFNYWGSLFLAFAYISALVLWVKGGRFQRLASWFGNAGRMALSNYLLQTLVCTSVFYGFGLGLFGQVERGGQFLIVIAVWVFQLLLSSFWMKRFRFGPMEWLWRSLTQVKVQPMKK